MISGYRNNLNNSSCVCPNLNFRAKKSAIAEESPIDKIARRVDEEKQKKHNKTAFAVGGSVLGLSILVMIFNPRISPKLIEKLRLLQTKSKHQLEESKDDFLKSKFYQAVTKIINGFGRATSVISNLNSVKDTYYKQLCTEEKTFFSINYLERRKRFAKYDKVFRKIMKKPHEVITKWGDSLAKITVDLGYKKAGRRMDKLELLIKKYIEKLPADKKSEVEKALAKISENRQYFSKEQLNLRFAEQENAMQKLNRDIRNKWNDYLHGYRNKYVNNREHFSDNLSFWAQDLMEADKARLSAENTKVLESLVGSRDGLKGEYGKIVETISSNINPEEKKSLEKAFANTARSLKKANNRECCDYFDKKRDLVLGSAPTDILSSSIFLLAGGVSLARANDKDKRISRLITGVLPVIAGVATNMILTTMLFSGAQAILLGAVTSIILSLTGSIIDKHRLAAKNKLPAEEGKETV